MTSHLTAITLILTVALGATVADAASGATYEVTGCKEAERETLPKSDWKFEPSGGDFELLVDCSMAPTALRTRSGTASTPYGHGAGMTFTAPSPLSITALSYRMLTNAPRSSDPGRPWWWDTETFVTDLDGRTSRAGGCYGGTSACSDYRYSRGLGFAEPRRAVSWFLWCTDDTPNACESSASMSMFDAVFTINDPESPRIVSPPSGEMFAGGHSLSGTQVTAVEAEDAGSGVYKATVEVDGVTAGSVTSTAAEYPTCARPFRVTRPCPPKIINGITVDTTTLTDGAHEALLRVYDATESNSATYGPVTFTTTNGRLINYCEDSIGREYKSNVPDRPLAFGQGWHYRARVPRSGGWEAVLLEGRDRVAVVGSGFISPGGRIDFKLPSGTSRLLRLGVRPRGSRGAYSCGQPAWLRVRPRLRVMVSPEEVSNGRSVRLRGRLLGAANRNRSIVIQARAIGSRRWATVRVIRSRRDGRFTMRYRFLSTFRAVTYAFRAQVRAAHGYPYATGTSREVRVRVFGS